MQKQQDKRVQLRLLYLVAATPMAVTALKVGTTSTPSIMLGFGVAMSIAIALLVQRLYGLPPFRRRAPELGKATAFRPWQTPVFWIPLALVAAIALFFVYVV